MLEPLRMAPRPYEDHHETYRVLVGRRYRNAPWSYNLFLFQRYCCTYATGTKQLVVHEALEITSCPSNFVVNTDDSNVSIFCRCRYYHAFCTSFYMPSSLSSVKYRCTPTISTLVLRGELFGIPF